MLLLDNDLKLKSYVAELLELVERAAKDGISLEILPSSTSGNALTDLLSLDRVRIPELECVGEVAKQAVCSVDDIADTSGLGHFGKNAKKVCAIYASIKSGDKEYAYVHTPDAQHDIPEPIDYSRYYKNDPAHPVNWLNPNVTVDAANLTAFNPEFSCCTQIDKFCNSDVWKGNLHIVVTTAIAELIQQKKLKYIGN